MSPPDAEQLPTPATADDADALLLRRIAAGDSAALGALYDRFSRPLYSLARHILNDAAEAEDVVHEVFVTLAEKARDYDRGRGSAFTWSATLTRNRAIDRVRTRRRRGELLAAAAPQDIGPAERSADSADPFNRQEVASAVRDAFGRLPLEQRRALELAYFGGLTQQEIAEKLGAPLGTVKARIRRGLLSLRELLPVRP